MANRFAGPLLDLFDLPRRASLHLISKSENEIYRIQAESGERWALRVQRPGYQSFHSLHAEISWLLALARDGVAATPLPIAGKNGEWIQVGPHPVTGEPHRLVLFAWEDGTEPSIDMDLGQTFRALGGMMASMHLHGIHWKRPANFERFRWDFDATLGESARWGRWRDGLGMHPAWIQQVERTTESVRRRLVSYGAGADRFGLAHCDLRLGNLLLHQGNIKVLDFDDCGFSWYMFDVANTVSFYEHLPQSEGLIETLLEAYQGVRPLSSADVEEIPTFLMLRRIQLMAWAGSHAETELSQSLGLRFTEQTLALCTAYLERFG